MALLRCFCAIFALAIPLFAQAADADDSPSSSAPGAQDAQRPRWEWNFSLRNRTGYRLDTPRRLQMSRTIFAAEGKYRLSDKWSLTLEARAHIDPVDLLGYPDSVWIDPRQAYLDGRVGKLDLRLGLQQIVWGVADGLRVLDVINPLDYREFILEDFLDSRRPIWAARADLPLEGGTLQLVWAPYFASARLPGPDAEFGLGDPFGVALIGAAIDEAGAGDLPPFTLRAEPTRRPGYRLESSQGGARYRRSLGAWDLTANYYYGWEEIPTSYVAGIRVPPGEPLPVVNLRPRYDRKEVFGLTGTTNFGPVVLRTEAGWFRRRAAAVRTGAQNNPNGDGPNGDGPDGDGFARVGQFSSVVGVDYSPREWVWLSGQYFLQFTSAPQASLLLPRYNHLASFFVRTNFFRETLRPELFVLTGLNQRQYLIRPRVVRTFGDHLSVGIGADFFGGRPITAFGHFERQDRAVLELKLIW